MKYYPGSDELVPPQVKAKIRKSPYLQARWRASYHEQQRKRAENSGSWSLPIPREIMDIILADPALGVREHVALAGELRRPISITFH